MNELPKRTIKKIFDLSDSGFSQLKIAKQLLISKNTVNRYLNIRKNVPCNEWPKVLKELFKINTNVNKSCSQRNNKRNKICELTPSSNYKDTNFQPIQYLQDCRETYPRSHNFRYNDIAQSQFQEFKEVELSQFKDDLKFLDECKSKINDLSFKIDELNNLKKKKQNQRSFEVASEIKNRQNQINQNLQKKRDEYNKHMESEIHNLNLSLIRNEKKDDDKLFSMLKELLNKKLEQEKRVQKTGQEHKINVAQKQKYQYNKSVSVLKTYSDAGLNSNQNLNFLWLAVNMGIMGYKMNREVKKYFNSSPSRYLNQVNRKSFL